MQEEEFNVLKGLASSLANGGKKAKLPEVAECESFGRFVTESIKKLDERTRHVVQYHINNTLFQAQMGMMSQAQVNLFVPQQTYNQQQQPNHLDPWINNTGV